MSYYDQKLVNADAEHIIEGLFTDIDELLVSSETAQTSSLSTDPDQVINRLFHDIDDLLESQENRSISISELLDPEQDAIATPPTPQISHDYQPFSREPIPYQSPGELTQKTPNSLVTPTTPPFREKDSQKPSSSRSLIIRHLDKILWGCSSLLVLAVLLLASQRNWSQFATNQLPDENPVTNVMEEVPNPITGSDNQQEPPENPNAEFIDYMEQASQQIHQQRRLAQQQQEKSELEKLRESLEALKQGQKELRQHQLALARQKATQPSSPPIPPHPPQPSSPPPASQTPASPPPNPPQPALPPPSSQTPASPPPPPSTPQSEPTQSSSSDVPESSAPSASKPDEVPKSRETSESEKIPSLPPVPSDSESEQVFAPQKPSESKEGDLPETSPQTNQTEPKSYKLVGVLELEESESAALLEKAGTTQQVLQGEMLPGSDWKLVNVSNQTATFEKDGNQKSLSIGQTFLSD